MSIHNPAEWFEDPAAVGAPILADDPAALSRPVGWFDDPADILPAREPEPTKPETAGELAERVDSQGTPARVAAPDQSTREAGPLTNQSGPAREDVPPTNQAEPKTKRKTRRDRAKPFPQENTTLARHETPESFCEDFRAASDALRQAFALIAKAKSLFPSALRCSFDIEAGRTHRISDYDLTQQTADRFTDDCLKILRRAAWAELVRRSQVRDLMSREKLSKLDADLKDGEMPPLTPEHIDAFLASLRETLPDLVADVIARAAEALRPRDKRYKTNGDGWQLKEKVIIEYVVENRGDYVGMSYSSWATERLALIDTAFHLLDGKGIPKHPNTLETAIRIAVDARKWETDTPYFKVKWFLNGNAHITMKRLDLVEQLNLRAAEHNKLREES